MSSSHIQAKADPDNLIESKLFTTEMEADRHMRDALAGKLVYSPCAAHPLGGPLDASEIEARAYHRSVSADRQNHTAWLVVIRRVHRETSVPVPPPETRAATRPRGMPRVT